MGGKNSSNSSVASRTPSVTREELLDSDDETHRQQVLRKDAPAFVPGVPVGVLAPPGLPAPPGLGDAHSPSEPDTWKSCSTNVNFARRCKTGCRADGDVQCQDV